MTQILQAMRHDQGEHESLLESIGNNDGLLTSPSKDQENYLAAIAIGDRLPYSNYTSIGKCAMA